MATDPLPSLRAALEISPDNVPLRLHVASLLLERGQAADAEEEYRFALKLEPTDAEIKFGLVRAYRAQGKLSQAHVVLDSLVTDPTHGARAYLERARTAFSEGEIEQSVRDYKSAQREDPTISDPDLAEMLGIDDSPTETWSEVEDGKLREAAGLPETERDALRPVRVDTTFADVGGMEELKDNIRKKILFPMQQPELYAAYGKKAGGGILLYGPPGCGKTHIARATAGELSASFLSVGLSDVLDMWVGSSQRNLTRIFEQAREQAPCVLFFDEVDGIGAKRADFSGSGGRQTVTELLSQLDGVDDKQNDGVLVLAATNAPWHLDSAFRRPGRFDRIVFVPPPDLAGRAEILRLLLRDKPQQDIDHQAVAKKTEGFSGADLAEVVNAAIEDKLDEAFKSGRPVPLVTKDLLKIAKRRKPSTREWFRTARNYVLYSNDGGQYDDLKPYVDA